MGLCGRTAQSLDSGPKEPTKAGARARGSIPVFGLGEVPGARVVPSPRMGGMGREHKGWSTLTNLYSGGVRLTDGKRGADADGPRARSSKWGARSSKWGVGGAGQEEELSM